MYNPEVESGTRLTLMVVVVSAVVWLPLLGIGLLVRTIKDNMQKGKLKNV